MHQPHAPSRWLARPTWRVGVVAALLPFLLPSPGSAQHGPQAGDHGHDVGDVRFGAACAPGEGPEFDRAVALLHHMMYEEAREAFEAVARRDSGCAMAHWGIAMTLFQPLWPSRPGAEQLRRGWEAVQRAKALAPGGDRDRALLAATEAFYRDPETADWWTRIRRWAEAMDAARDAHPDDVEVAAFWALSHLAAGQVAEDRISHQARAAAALAELHARRPRHPGAIHYTIHANDVDGRAGESLEVVESYSGIAPSVPHALHMPTHIYVRLGAWPEVIDWNRRSADAALRFPAPGGATSHHYVHALDYLVYAYLQRGEDERAAAALEEARERAPHQASFLSAFHLAAMPARFAVERRAWGDAAALEPRSPAGLPWDSYPWPEALTWLARGLGAIHTGEVAAAENAQARMAALREAAEAAGEAGMARYIEIDRRILAGWLSHARGDPETAVQTLRSAAELEGTVQKHPVTPGALMPPREALGDLFLALKRPVEALSAYEASLQVWPGRFHSLLGAARAARAAGKEETARRHYRALLEVAAHSARSGVREAQRFLSGKEAATDRKPFEVWAADQNANVLHVLDPEGKVLRSLDEPTLGGAERPHMLVGVPGDPWVYSANTVSNSVTVLGRSDGRVAAVISNVGKAPHAAQPNPRRPERVYVMNIAARGQAADGSPDRGETITEFVRRASESGPIWEAGRTLDLKAASALADSSRFPSRRPVCAGFSRDGRTMLVTLFDGGLAAVDLEAWRVSRAWGGEQIARHGCGFAPSPEGGELYVTAGSLEASWLYVFDVAGEEPVLAASHDLSAVGQDAHGAYVDPVRRELWVVHRVSSNVTIHPLAEIRVPGHRFETIPFVGRTPDLVALSPDASRAFLTLRGPKPAPTIPHATVGETPGIAVIDVERRELLQVVPLGDPKEGDFHGIFVPAAGQ